MLFHSLEEGGCYVLPEDLLAEGLTVGLHLQITVDEQSNVFVERQRSSKICYEVAWSGKSDEESIVISTSIQEPRETSLENEGERKRIGCVSFTEEGEWTGQNKEQDSRDAKLVCVNRTFISIVFASHTGLTICVLLLHTGAEL